MKQWFEDTRHQAVKYLWSLSDESNEVSIMNVPVYYLEKFPSHGSGRIDIEEPRKCHGRITELLGRKKSLNFK